MKSPNQHRENDADAATPDDEERNDNGQRIGIEERSRKPPTDAPTNVHCDDASQEKKKHGQKAV